MSLPADVWVMMIFSILAFFGVSIWALVYTLRQEEQKMIILSSEKSIDTHSPRALRELKQWIDANADDPDIEVARDTYRECVDAVRSTDQHFHDWTKAEIDELETL